MDVVNGGYDQKSFLLMATQHEATVCQAFEQYRRRVFPFSIREERFRDALGPPPAVIHVFSKINANLSSIDKLFSSSESWKQTAAQSDQSAAEAESRADSSLTPGRAGEQFAAATASTLEAPSQPSHFSDPTVCQSDRVSFSSPIKKKYWASSQCNELEDIGGTDEAEGTDERVDCQTKCSVTNEVPNAVMSINSDSESLLPFSQAVCTPLPDDNHTESQPVNNFDDISTDLENPYSNQNSHGGGLVS